MATLDTLKTRKQFLHIANKGQTTNTKGLLLQAAKSQDDPIKYGITASRKVGNAVKRNKVKRRLRALANNYMPVYALEGYEYVLIGKRTTIDRSFSNLKKDLIRALQNLELSKEGK